MFFEIYDEANKTFQKQPCVCDHSPKSSYWTSFEWFWNIVGAHSCAFSLNLHFPEMLRMPVGVRIVDLILNWEKLPREKFRWWEHVEEWAMMIQSRYNTWINIDICSSLQNVSSDTSQPDYQVHNNYQNLSVAQPSHVLIPLRNISIDGKMYNLDPIGPAPVGYEFDPTWVPYVYNSTSSIQDKNSIL